MQTTSNIASYTPHALQQPHGAWRWGRRVAGSVVLIAGLLAATSAMNAWAAPEGPQRGKGQDTCMAHGGKAHMGAGMPFMGPILHKGGRGLERWLTRLDATPEQRTRIQGIAQAARADLDVLHQQAKVLKTEAQTVMRQPKVDAAEAERVRARMMAHHDAVSKRMWAAMIEVSEVLTPAQREALAQRMSERRGGDHKRKGSDKGSEVTG